MHPSDELSESGEAAPSTSASQPLPPAPTPPLAPGRAAGESGPPRAPSTETRLPDTPSASAMPDASAAPATPTASAPEREPWDAVCDDVSIEGCEPEEEAAKPMSPGAIAVAGIIAAIFVAIIVGFAAGFLGSAFGSRINPLLPERITVVGATTDEPVAAAAAAALQSVVNIDVTSETSASNLPTGHPDVPMMGNGSGVAYKPAPNGGTFILTNNHVVEGATSIKVTDAQGISHPGTIVGADKESDIAVVRIAEKLPIVQLGDSNKLIVGQLAVAIGSPFGLDHSVSSGVVSAIHRSLSGQADFGSASNLIDVIQTDAAINPGNSGGALVDRVGKLIGINTAIYSQSGSSSGVGFAIPVNTAIRVANDLIAKGVATHPFLGVQGRSLDATLAAQLKLPVTQGAWVEKVLPGGSAEKAGLKPNDVVVQVGTREVRRWEDLQSSVRDLTVGSTVDVTIYRAGTKQTLTLTVGERPK